jgi:hypothetical protein
MKHVLLKSNQLIIKYFFLFAFHFMFCMYSDGQTNSAKIILIREGMHEGSAAASSIFMNDELLCKLNNKKFSIHNVSPGRYSFHAQWGGSKRRGDKRGDIEIDIEDGKTYYLKFNMVSKAFNGYVGLIDVTEATFNKLKDELKLDEECL